MKNLDISSLVQSLITLGAIVLAGLMSINKIKWNKPFKIAKEAEIKVLNEKIDLYKKMSSPTIFETLSKQKNDLEAIVKSTEEEIKKIKEINKKGVSSEEHEKLKNKHISLMERVERMQETNTLLMERQEEIQNMAEELNMQAENLKIINTNLENEVIRLREKYEFY